MVSTANSIAKALGVVAFVTCIVAVFDPRFRKLCLSLLCRL